MAQAQIGDIGVVLRLNITTNLDLSGATVKKIRFDPPGSAASLYVDGAWADATYKKLQYTTVQASDLPVAGVYRAQAYFELPTGEKVRTSWGTFAVGPNLA